MAQIALSLEVNISEAQSEIDQLLAEISGGVRDQRHFDELEERASRIGEQLRFAFRSAVK